MTSCEAACVHEYGAKRNTNVRFTIKAASISDADAICRLSSEDLGYPCTAALVKEKLKKLDQNREMVYVALSGEYVAGYIHVEKYDVLYFETMANLLGLAVDAAYQHRGIGKKLVTAAETWAAANGIKMMRLNSGISRKAAHDFYRHLGYESEKEQLRFVKHLG